MSVARVVIVGGGLAGLAAAEALSRHHPALNLTLLESKRITGGRTGSYIDPKTESEVDYCQHAAMGCCTNLIDMLERCGLKNHFRRFRELTFLHPDHPPSRFAASRFLPPPLHLLGTINALRYLSARQKRQIKIGLWRLMRTRTSQLGPILAREWLSKAGQSDETIRDFWDVILVSALGEQTDRVSMAAARKVLIDGFAIARGASDVLVPTLPLAELFGRLLADVLTSRGVTIRTGQTVTQISSDGRVIAGNETLESDAVICAVPWHRIARLFQQWPDLTRSQLPDLDAITNIPGSPITGLHLWFDSPITDLDHAVMVGTVSQWMFRNPCEARPESLAKILPEASKSARQYYYQVVISASRDIHSESKAELVETVLAEVRHAFPAARDARLVRHRLVTDPNSVFSLCPDVEAIRPATSTGVPGLYFAGDWTKTGWPATMEGAVISGRLAAKSVKNQLQIDSNAKRRRESACICPGLRPGRLARWLIRQD